MYIRQYSTRDERAVESGSRPKLMQLGVFTRANPTARHHSGNVLRGGSTYCANKGPAWCFSNLAGWAHPAEIKQDICSARLDLLQHYEGVS